MRTDTLRIVVGPDGLVDPTVGDELVDRLDLPDLASAAEEHDAVVAEATERVTAA